MPIKAVSPYIYKNQLNFKNLPFQVWKSIFPDRTYKGWYPRFLQVLFFRFDIFPSIWHTRNETLMLFAQPISLYFDANISVVTHEVIPVLWDCWPKFYDKVEKWLNRHKVKTAIFTSSEAMAAMHVRCPNIKTIWCPEAVDETLYQQGKELKDRSIDLLEFGRSNNLLTQTLLNKDGFYHVSTLVDDKFIFTDEQFYLALGDAKITICLPRNITHPEIAQGVETLTQRYWEAMLSRIIIVGHAPKELVDICGYNPVIEIETDGNSKNSVDNTILNILNHLDDYQELVDKNRETALLHGRWSTRIKWLTIELNKLGYVVAS